MSLRFLLDEHVHGGMAARLRERGIDALSVAEAGRRSTSDADLLEWARAERRVVVSLDSDFIPLGRTMDNHSGVIFLRKLYAFGEMLELLDVASKLYSEDEMRGLVIYV